MTHKQALTDLLAKVEAGAEHKVVGAIADVFGEFGLQAEGAPWYAYNAYHHSLNAAKALHEEVANGFVVTIDRSNDGSWVVTIRLEPRVGTFSGTTSDNPARAWLIAILRALIAECDQ